MDTIDIRPQRQLYDLWCWAAVGSTIVEYLTEVSLTQCEFAARHLGRDDCCTNSDLCVQGEYFSEVLRGFGCLRDNGVHTGRLSIDDLEHEICARRYPVPVRISGGGLASGHVIIIFGIDRTNGDYVALFDPRREGRNERVLEYSAFPEEHIAGTVWTHTYLLEDPS